MPPACAGATRRAGPWVLSDRVPRGVAGLIDTDGVRRRGQYESVAGSRAARGRICGEETGRSSRRGDHSRHPVVGVIPQGIKQVCIPTLC